MTTTMFGYRLWADADTANRLLIVLIIFSVQKPPLNRPAPIIQIKLPIILYQIFLEMSLSFHEIQPINPVGPMHTTYTRKMVMTIILQR